MFPFAFTTIDMFDRGLVMEGGMMGMVGHSLVQVGGQTILGAPLSVGLVDMAAMVIGEMSFNHSGSIGFGYWEDNLPSFLNVKDPALDVLKFQMCGNIFFPIPGVPIPLMKPFEIWGFPWYFPTGIVFKFSFFFGDTGGCLFMDGGFGASGSEVGAMGKTGLKWIMVMPIAIKLLLPSWLFILSDVKVRGHSVEPCIFGICKATVHSGQFSTSGPRTPMLKVLIETTAAKDCSHLELLPDVSFTLMGSTFTMNREEYVIYGNNFGNKECLTAFTPSADLIEAFSMWIFGDMWIRVFYTVFDQVPLRRIGFAKADQRYYEKNGCGCGQGRGPIDTFEPQEVDVANSAAAYAENDNIRLTTENKKIMGIKRYQNWQADIKGEQAKKNAAEVRASGPAGPCMSGMRFKRTGACIPPKMIPEIDKLREFHDANQRRGEGEARFSESRVEEEAGARAGAGGDDGQRLRSRTGAFFEDSDPHITVAQDAFSQAPEGMADAAEEEEERENEDFNIATAGEETLFVELSSETGISSTSPLSGLGPYRQQSIMVMDGDGKQYRGENAKCPAPSVEGSYQHRSFFEDVENGGLGAATGSSGRLRAKARRRKFEDWRTRQTELLDIGAETGAQIHLSMDAVKTEQRMAELYYNTTRIFKSWRPLLNVSGKMTRTYWRGEHEEHINIARDKAARDWHELLTKARRRIKASSVMSMLNKRVLKRVLEKNWPEDDEDSTTERDPAKVFTIENDIYNGDRVNERDDWGVMAGVYDSSIIGGKLVSDGTKKEEPIDQPLVPPVDSKQGAVAEAGAKTIDSGVFGASDAKRAPEKTDVTGKDNKLRFKAEAEKFFSKMAGWAAQAMKQDPEFWKQLGANGKGGSDSKAPWEQLTRTDTTATGKTPDTLVTDGDDKVGSMLDLDKGDNIPGYDEEWLKSYLKDTKQGNAGKTMVLPKEMPGPQKSGNVDKNPTGRNTATGSGIGDDDGAEDEDRSGEVDDDDDADDDDDDDDEKDDGMVFARDGTRFATVATEITDQDPKVIAQSIKQNTIRVGEAWQQEINEDPEGLEEPVLIEETVRSADQAGNQGRSQSGRNGKGKRSRQRRQHGPRSHNRFSAESLYADIERKHREHVIHAKLKLIELEEQLAEAEISRNRRSKTSVNEISHAVRAATSFFDPVTGRVRLPEEKSEEEEDEEGGEDHAAGMEDEGRRRRQGRRRESLLRDQN